MIMNKIITQFCLLCLLLIVASCNKDPEYYTLEVPADQMLLKASSTEVALSKEYENETAVTFTWDAATDRGADASITYYFKMYMVELNSNVTKLYEVEEGQRSISFTHSQFNDILAAWNMAPGSKVTIEAEVIAKVNSSIQYLKPELSKTQLDVIGYDKNAAAIYMVMVADNGEKTVRRMTEKVAGNAIYRSTVDLLPCKYYFSLSSDADYPCYMKGASGDNSLQYVTEAGNYEMLENTLTGVHEVIVNLGTYNVRIIPKICELPNNGIWIIGDGCSAVGWNVDKAFTQGAMTNSDPAHPELWTYEGNFTTSGEGAFKLLAGTKSEGYQGYSFFAPVEWANPSANHLLKLPRKGGNDWKWRVAASGKYTLVLDLSAMTISLNPVVE